MSRLLESFLSLYFSCPARNREHGVNPAHLYATPSARDCNKRSFLALRVADCEADALLRWLAAAEFSLAARALSRPPVGSSWWPLAVVRKFVMKFSCVTGETQAGAVSSVVVSEWVVVPTTCFFMF